MLWPAIATTQPAPAPLQGYPQPPQALFKELFVAVQSAAIYPDSKDFADAVPKAAPDVILARYRASRPDSPLALRDFVDATFVLPAAAGPAPAMPRQQSVSAHIDGLWDALTRSTTHVPPYASLLPLPGRMWFPAGDLPSSITGIRTSPCLGLMRADSRSDRGHDGRFRLSDRSLWPRSQRQRSYYLSRSQPPSSLRWSDCCGRRIRRSLCRYLSSCSSEYDFWMAGAAPSPGAAHRRVVAMADGSILNRYWDDLDPPRDENFGEDTELAQKSGRPPGSALSRHSGGGGKRLGLQFALVHRLRQRVRPSPPPKSSRSTQQPDVRPRGCDPNSGCRGRTPCGLCRNIRGQGGRASRRHRSLRSGTRQRALFSTIPSRNRRAAPPSRLRRCIRCSSSWPTSGRRVTVRREWQRQSAAAGRLGHHRDQDRDAVGRPNGWAPLQWIAVAGLRNYEHASLAAAIACRWIVTVSRGYRASGKLVEKYDVIATDKPGGGGEYPLQDGFGWTNGVLLRADGALPRR